MVNKSIETRTGNVHYEDRGNGFSLVFLHGLCEDGFIWEKFISGLEKTYRILRPDLPGCGKSSLSLDPVSLTIDDYANVVFDILEKENINECAVIGHSMGGYSALAFAEKHPGLIKGMCLFHSSAFADDDSKKAERQKVTEFIARNGGGDFIKQLFKNNFSEDFYRNNQSQVRELVDRAKKFPKEGAMASMQAMKNRPDRLAVLRDAKFPVQFIIGKKDKAIPLERSLRECHLPSVSSILILNESAHMGFFEEKEKCQSGVADWLKLIA